MNGALVISLDFELHWGVRDHVPLTDAAERRMRAARKVVEELLARFADAGVSATWATVGFLFAGGAAELERLAPAVRPAYADAALDPYREAVGTDEASDPSHFARSLIEKVARTPGQEVGTHTYSHYYCLDDTAGSAAFEADLASAVKAASEMGITLRSIVFPRNQIRPECLPALARHGIRNYRGNSLLGGTLARRGGVVGPAYRASRFADAFVPLSGAQDYPWRAIPEANGLRDVRASLFLRVHAPRSAVPGGMHVRRVVGAMRHAARSGRVFHLWWHPHNFASHPEHCFAALASVLAEFDRLRGSDGMRSLTMDEAGNAACG